MLRKTIVSTLFVVGLLAIGAAGCKSSAEGAAAEKAGEATAKSADKSVARVVFVGKKDCCDCTQRRINVTRDALFSALEGTKLPLEQLQVDVQADAIEPLRQKQPFMALPAVYLLDADGALVEMLQGELTVDQLRAALAKK